MSNRQSLCSWKTGRVYTPVWYDHFVQASQVHSAKADNEGGVPATCVVWTLQSKMVLSLYYPKKHSTPKDNWKNEQQVPKIINYLTEDKSEKNTTEFCQNVKYTHIVGTSQT